VLQTQDLRVGQINEPCIGLTQENSIVSRLKKVDLTYFIYFLFLEQIGLGLIGHTVTSATT